MLRGRTARWVAGVAAAVVALGSAIGIAAGASIGDVPSIPADRLLASVVRAVRSPGPISGEVATHVDLGLPQVVDSRSADAAGGPFSALLGDHRLRIWSSPDGLRVADLLPDAERSLIVSRHDAWAWDSKTFTARHLRYGGKDDHGRRAPHPKSYLRGLSRRVPSPLELARLALDAVDATATASVRGSETVAGRAAHVLVLRPRTPATLVDRLEVSVDVERRIVLRLAVFARGASDPAISAGFTSISFDPIDPSTFRFSPPPGARVIEAASKPGHDLLHGVTSRIPIFAGWLPSAASGAPHVRVFGDGWATIIAVRVPSLEALPHGTGAELPSLLPFSGPLFSARLVDAANGAWLVYGAVPQSALARVERDLS